MNRPRHSLISGSLLLSAALSSLACAEPSGNKGEFMDRIEARIAMPDGALPLERYSRAYFPFEGGKKVMGLFTTTRPAGRSWVERNPGPFVMDGGCAIVMVIVDAASERIEKVECNGVG